METAATSQEFMNRLDNMDQIVQSEDLLLNEDLQATEKWGLRWIVRVILCPIRSLFCCDVFADVRIVRVAQRLQTYFQSHQGRFTANDAFRLGVTAVSNRLVAKLKERTHHRYDAILDRVLEQRNVMLNSLRSDPGAAQPSALETSS